MDSELIIRYYREGKPIREVAALCNCAASTVRKILIRCGEKLRDKSEAQSLALKKGTAVHPTKGKERSEETKIKIANTVSNAWNNLSEEEYEKRVDKARENWNNMSETERDELLSLAAEGLRRASKEGSRVEKVVVETLRKAGHEVIHHKKGIIPNEKLEVDIFLPRINLIIEIDGPTHFLPIWGEDKLDKHIKADSVKSGLLISRGYTIIRVKHLLKNASEKVMRDLANSIVAKIEEIKDKKLSDSDRFIELTTGEF